MNYYDVTDGSYSSYYNPVEFIYTRKRPTHTHFSDGYILGITQICLGYNKQSTFKNTNLCSNIYTHETLAHYYLKLKYV